MSRSRILLPALLLLLSPTPGRAAEISQSTFHTDIQILERLARERYAEGDLRRAAELYQEIAVKQSEPEAKAKALFTGAWLLHLAGDTSKPVQLLTRSLTIDVDQPFDASLYNRDFELLYRQALASAQRERRQKSAAQTQLGVAELEAGREPQARLLLEEALRLDAGNPAALYNLALLDLRSGAAPEALADFERVVSLTYKESGNEMTNLRAKSLVGIGIIYQRQGRPQDAEQSFLEATRVDPGEPSAWTRLGLLHFHNEQFQAAVVPLEHATELDPDDREVVEALVRSLDGTGQAGQATMVLESFLGRHPNEALLWQTLATLEAGQGQTEAALRALEKSIFADGNNQAGIALAAAVDLASLHLQREEFQSALDRANQALAWDRTSAQAWAILGQTQLAMGDEAEATASLTRAAELDPESAARQITLGDLFLADAKLPQAEAAYLRALSLDPNSTEAVAKLKKVRGQLANERAIVAGNARPRKPVPPKKIGLEFAGIDYKDLHLRGALVKQVKKKSPAARAGLRKGDLVLWIGDYAVVSDKDFMQFLKRNPPGNRLDIEYLRDGRIYDTAIQLR
jgi:tetratricopeptide (TPR) repeat protein